VKVSLDIDCTPEEARRFMGLPDLTPIHEAYVAKLGGFMNEGITPDVMTDMMKSWGPMSEAGMKMWTGMFDQLQPKT
jgi:hypothetical protein